MSGIFQKGGGALHTFPDLTFYDFTFHQKCNKTGVFTILILLSLTTQPLYHIILASAPCKHYLEVTSEDMSTGQSEV